MQTEDSAPTTTTTERLEELARDLVGYWNCADWAAYRRSVHVDYRYRDAGRDTSDVEEVLAGWRQVTRAYPDAAAEVVDVLVGERATVIGLVWRATHTGPDHPPQRREPPTGKRIELADTVTVRWCEGRIVDERHGLGLLAALVAPAGPVRPPAPRALRSP